MNLSKQAARPAAFAQSLSLFREVPRKAWPALIERAADALQGRPEAQPEALALTLQIIAITLHNDRYSELCDALRDCIEASQPMAQYHATEHARRVLRRIGGAA